MMRVPVLLVAIWSFAPGALGDTFDMVPHVNSPKGEGIYRCETLDGVSVTAEGRLLRDNWAEWFIEDYAHFEFDAETGRFRSNNQDLDWVVLRGGDKAWDLIAHLPGVDTSFNMMRIEVWNDPVRFVMTNGKQFYSGICTKL